MERYYATGQSPQRAVVPMEEEEKEEEEEDDLILPVAVLYILLGVLAKFSKSGY